MTNSHNILLTPRPTALFLLGNLGIGPSTVDYALATFSPTLNSAIACFLPALKPS